MEATYRHDRKIVSPGAYLRIQSLRFSLWFYCLLCYLMALVCLALIVAFSCGLLRFAPWPILQWSMVTSSIWMFLFLPALIYLCSSIGAWCRTRSAQIEAVSPLTAHRADTLPAPQSLVRASKEPAQKQQAVLLRAATAVSETPATQLVRPAGRTPQEPQV